MVALVASWMLAGGVMVWGAAAASASDIAVDIVDDTATPAPSAPAPAPQASSGPGGGSGSGYSGSTSSPVPVSTPIPVDTAPPGERIMFVVSGLTAVGHPSANPLAGGRVTAEVTVQNLTGEALDASVDFRVDDIFGNELASLSDVPIGNLLSGDRRTIDVDLGDVRISGLVHVSATVTPPSQVGDLELSPVKRDAWTMLPSWYAVGFLLATAASLATWAYLRYGRKL
ncbi:hypothetical protein FBY39_1826 [Microbacterium sp. SLBN-146]|nr:hypothetical protein FBY39_1826 [Microbacterium sp. SLBN-146]